MDREPTISRHGPLDPPPTDGGLRFVGLGDSLTQGVGDPRPGRAGFSGELDGWVSHFVAAVRSTGQPVDVLNLAVAGSRLHHVLEDQIPQLPPDPIDIVSCFIGINDLWYSDLDLDEFGERFNVLFRELSVRSPVVITASVHDVFAPLPVRAAVREKLSRTIASMNEIINGAVVDHGLVLVDLAGRSEMFTSAVRAVDRLHPNRYGHQLIAAEVVNQLHDRGHLLNTVPPFATPVRRGAPDLAHIAWVSGYVRRNWKRWRTEMAAAKAAASGSSR